MGVTLTPPGEYDWTVRVRRWCGYFVKLLWPLFVGFIVTFCKIYFWCMCVLYFQFLLCWNSSWVDVPSQQRNYLQVSITLGELTAVVTSTKEVMFSSFVCFHCLLATLRKNLDKGICMKFSGKVGNGPVNKWLNFGGDLDQGSRHRQNTDWYVLSQCF